MKLHFHIHTDSQTLTSYTYSSSLPCVSFLEFYNPISIVDCVVHSTVFGSCGCSIYDGNHFGNWTWSLWMINYIIWLSYSPNNWTWDPIRNLVNAKELWYPNRTSPSLCIAIHGTHGQRGQFHEHIYKIF